MAAPRPRGPNIAQLTTPAAVPDAPKFNPHRDWERGNIVTIGDNSLTWEIVNVVRYDDGAIGVCILQSGQSGRRRSELPEKLKMFREQAVQFPPLAVDEVRAICPSCREHLGDFVADGGMSAQWWADKALQEHSDEAHD